MRIPRPSSIRSLVLLGFGVVIVPLRCAVGYAMVSLERLGDQRGEVARAGAVVVT